MKRLEANNKRYVIIEKGNRATKFPPRVIPTEVEESRFLYRL